MPDSSSLSPAPGHLDPFPLQAADAIILAALALFSLLAGICWQTVPGWGRLIAANLGVAALVVASAIVTPRVRRPAPRFLLRTATISLAYAYLFGAVANLQMIVHGHWLDDRVLGFEQRLLGVQLTVWVQPYIRPWLTEWLMFCYVVYIPLYPILCAIIRFQRGAAAMEDYFFTLGLTNILCDLGFILYPVASPLHWIKDRFHVPLDGYAFAWIGEYIRANLHYPGGSIPSPHAAAATVMWLMAWKYHRPTFWIIAPIVVSLYVSTFYGRYHYATDAVVGIATAGLAACLAPLLQRAWTGCVGSRSS